MSKRKGEPKTKDIPKTENVALAKVKEDHRRLKLTTEGPLNPHTADSYSTFLGVGVDNTFNIEEFKKGVKVTMRKQDEERVEFDLKGVDPPIANALRRTLLSDVETVAIETVHLYQNTGVMHDEIFCHRLGLVPMFVPNFQENLEYPPLTISDPTISQNIHNGSAVQGDELSAGQDGTEPSEAYALKFKLHVKCPSNHPRDQSMPVTSGDFVWEPLSERQKEAFKDCPPRPVHSDILLTKLRQGQEIEAYCFAMRGIGRTHAKWSPVCTAFYKLKPDIRINGLAQRVKDVCPMGVFDIEDSALQVVDQRACTTCRACIEDEDMRQVIDLGKTKDTYIFSVETTGALPADELVPMALDVLGTKCDRLLDKLGEFVVEMDEDDSVMKD